MPLHFAPAFDPTRAPTLVNGRSAAASRFAKAMAGRAIERVANDNVNADGSLATSASTDDRILRAALRHFAQHGLGAARDARMQAEQAFFDGDRAAYTWWLGVTRALDRRLAVEAEAAVPGAKPETART